MSIRFSHKVFLLCGKTAGLSVTGIVVNNDTLQWINCGENGWIDAKANSPVLLLRTQFNTNEIKLRLNTTDFHYKSDM